ncbi:hypothetical protein [Leptolyngbya sp. O-77]|uniref:hypothetical protein n=1 Tax=Leptolyngbya sp. O-77 TaxID=1080068 RepID=UPI0018D3F04E|nr:hypothetical protein [Leptolyngbya sp. O-77]
MAKTPSSQSHFDLAIFAHQRWQDASAGASFVTEIRFTLQRGRKWDQRCKKTKGTVWGLIVGNGG